MSIGLIIANRLDGSINLNQKGETVMSIDRIHLRFQHLILRSFTYICIMTICSFLSVEAYAGILAQRDASDNYAYTALANLSQYESVGAIVGQTNFGTGTLINHRTILTAAHIFDKSVNPADYTFNLGPDLYHPSGSYGISDIKIHSDYDKTPEIWGKEINQFRSKFDIALVELSTPALGLNPSEIYRGSNEKGKTTVLVGYGKSGTGDTGITIDGGTKLAGNYDIDDLVNKSPIIVGNYSELKGNFDNPILNSPPGTTYTYSLNDIFPAPGDSGAPLYLDNQIAGIVSRGTGSKYDDVVYSTRVSHFDDWIDDNLFTSVLYKGMGESGDDDKDYGNLVMQPNDDGSSNKLELPFDINFYGNTYDSFWINNNGNISFENSLWEYTPEAFPISDQPMIAPYWGDVDTLGTGSVYVASPDENTVVITWDEVGYFPAATDKTNTFQVVLINRDDVSVGDFDIEFRYDNLEWTTGDASGGVNGLGGTEAQAGFDAGDRTNFYTLPGSRSAAVLNLTGNSNTELDGFWQFAVRSGETPGSAADNPLMPVVTGGIDTFQYSFDFNIGDIDDQIFIDPLVAIGYEYVIENGPNVRTVLLPYIGGDNLFDLWLFDAILGNYYDTDIDILSGVEFDFGIDGVDRFAIWGIEPDLGLDPMDATAFVTGLTFTNTGFVQMTQTPMNYDTGTPVPEPSTILLLGVGMLALLALNRRMIANS